MNVIFALGIKEFGVRDLGLNGAVNRAAEIVMVESRQQDVLKCKVFIRMVKLTWLRLAANCCTGNSCCGGGYGGVVGRWIVVVTPAEVKYVLLQVKNVLAFTN